MEMTRLWKSQTDFHSRLEISHTTRDSHIPTADHRCFRFEERRMNRPSSGSLSDRPTGLVSERRAQLWANHREEALEGFHRSLFAHPQQPCENRRQFHGGPNAENEPGYRSVCRTP